MAPWLLWIAESMLFAMWDEDALVSAAFSHPQLLMTLQVSFAPRFQDRLDGIE